MKKIVSFMFLMFSLFSCNEEDNGTNFSTKDFSVENEKEITDYINSNNLKAQKTATGLYYVIENEGDGSRPNISDNVTVAYKGYFPNGKVFDESEKGISFGLQQVIRGWTEGIPKFKEGGKGILLIPSHLAYGNQGTRGIPGGAVLVFDIELLSVN